MVYLIVDDDVQNQDGTGIISSLGNGIAITRTRFISYKLVSFVQKVITACCVQIGIDITWLS